MTDSSSCKDFYGFDATQRDAKCNCVGYFKVFLKIFLLTKFIFTELLKKMVETQKFCLGKVDLLNLKIE